MRRAIVIGSGPNGLAGALALARAGFDVTVLEAADRIGGGTRTEALTLPGFLHDVCSAVHPLAQNRLLAADLAAVEWVHPDAPAAHPLDDGTAVLLERDVEATAAGLGADGPAYRRLVGPLARAWDAVEPVLLGPLLPGPDAVLRAGRALGPVGLARAARASLLDARSLAGSAFRTERARAFFAGHAAHSLLPLERRPSAGFALSLLTMGHALGWPSPRGGAGRIAEALGDRLDGLGGSVETGVLVEELPRADVVLASVLPRDLLRIAGGRLPQRYRRDLERYRHGPGAFKLDWALDGPIPWRAGECARAGTVHVGGSFDEIAASEWAAWTGRPSERPFVIVGQQSLFDPTRAPDGRHTAWAYCHVPNGWSGDMTGRVEAQIERFAPGFRDRILARHTLGPADLERHDRNLAGGDLNAGAMDLGQLLFRPARRLVPYRTPVPGLYLCSAATPPGGGVHGMCGYGAAGLALRDLGRSTAG